LTVENLDHNFIISTWNHKIMTPDTKIPASDQYTCKYQLYKFLSLIEHFAII